MFAASTQEAIVVSRSHLRWAARLGMADAPTPQTVGTMWLRASALRSLLDAHCYPSELDNDNALDPVMQLLPDLVANAGYVVSGPQRQP